MVDDPVSAEAGPKPARFTLSRTGSTAVALPVTVRFDNTDASYLADFTTLPALGPAVIPTDTNYGFYHYLSNHTFGTLTIPAGSASLIFTATPANDALQQGERTINVGVAPTPAYLVATGAGGPFVIEDNDTTRPTLSFSPASGPANYTISTRIARDSATPARVRVTRSGPINTSLSIGYNVSTKTLNDAYPVAVADVDYFALPGNLLIPAGSRSAEIEIQPRAATNSAGSRFLSLTLTTGASAFASSTSSAYNLEIYDSTAPRLTLVATDPQASSVTGDPGRFTVTRTGPNTNTPLTVGYSVGGSALHGSDYRALPGSVTIPAGQASADIVITPIPTLIGAPEKTIVLALATTDQFRVEGSPTATVNLSGDTRTLWVASTGANALEGGTDPGRFTLTRGGSTASALIISYTLSGTASNGTDYVDLSGTAIFPAGQASIDLFVNPKDDTVIEETESVTLTLVAPAGYAVSPVASATLLIRDNDGPTLPSVTVGAQSESGNESFAGGASFRFERTGDNAAPLTVAYTIGGTATPGIDYTALPGIFTIPAGQIEAFLSFNLVNDTLAEGAETVVLTLTPNLSAYRVEGVGTATYLIGDDETPAVQVRFASATGSGPETAGVIPLTVQLSGASASTVTVKYAVAGGQAIGNGVDYLLPSGTLSFAPGETSKTIPLQLMDDQAPESAETVAVRLSDPGRASLGTPVIHTYTITSDRDTEPIPPGSTVAFATVGSEVSEAVGNAVVRVSRHGATSGEVVVNYIVDGSAARPSDHGLAAGNLLFATGETEKIISVPIVNDALPENDESVVITLGTPAGPANLGAPSSHTLTIRDNDGIAPAVISTPPAAATVGKPFSYTLVTTGTPAPTISVTGLPAWLIRSGNTFSGTPPTPHTLGPVMITAANNAGPAAVQILSIEVGFSASPYETWKETHFSAAQLVDSGASGSSADPDADGLPNLLEYALGGDPTTAIPLVHPRPDFDLATSRLQLAFNRYLARTDLTLTVQAADSPAGPWIDIARSTGGNAFTALVTGTGIAETGTGDARQVTVTDPTSGTRRFIRLKVDSTP